jgi:hypothetical protein
MCFSPQRNIVASVIIPGGLRLSYLVVGYKFVISKICEALRFAVLQAENAIPF